MLVTKLGFHCHVKTLLKIQILILLLITGLSQSISKTTIENAGKLDSAPLHEYAAPLQFPDSEHGLQGTPIVHLKNLINNTDEQSINIIKEVINNTRQAKLSLVAPAINNTRNLHVPNNHVSNSNRSHISQTQAEDAHSQTRPANHENDNSTSPEYIATFAFIALMSVTCYVGLVVCRKILERKYGNRDLLVQNDKLNKSIDYYC